MAYDGPFPQTVPEGGTGATTLTGILTGNGTSAITATAVTQHDVLVGAASNAVTSVSPSTAGFILTSNGTGADPSFQVPAIVGALTYFFTNTASDVAGELQQTATAFSPKTTQTFAGLVSGNTLLETFITNAGNPGLSFLPAGTYSMHVHASQSAGTRNMTLFAEIWEATSLGVDIAKIGTTGSTAIISGTEVEYQVDFTVGIYTLASTASRIKTKVFANGAVAGSNATVLIFVGGTADSHTTLPGPVADVTNFVPYTGAINSVNLGPNSITALSATLTNPLTVPNGGTGAATLTGVLTGNGVSAVTASAVTQFDVLVGGASNAISSVGPGSAGQILQSGGNAANPAYSTATYPATAGTAGKVLISDGTNIVSSTPTFPNASATAGKFIRSDGTNWIASTPTLPTTAGTSGKVLQSNGTNYIESTPTYPSASGTSGKILISDGTNNVYSTPTYPNAAGTSGNILTSDGTNIVSSSPAGAGASLVFLASRTASNSASLEFKSVISSTYTTYILVMSNVVPITNGDSLQMQISTDNGVSYINSGYQSGLYALGWNSATVNNANSTSFISLSPAINSGANIGTTGKLILYNVQNGSQFYCNGDFVCTDTVPQKLIGFLGSGNTATSTNAFKVFMSTGNISTGVFTLYGLRES